MNPARKFFSVVSGALLVAAALVSGVDSGAAAPPAQVAATTQADAANETVGLLIGGVGGVYFLAEPGELVVEVEKRDRNLRGGRTELRAILAGPDRRVLQESTIPDDGQARGSGLGPVQRCRLSARVESKGVYVLNITVSQDRYGEEAVWGFRSNCRKYVIETARGHKDEAHQEPIVLASPNRSANVCFLPRTETFGLEITGLPKDAAPLQVFDASGKSMVTLPVSTNGRVAHQFPADLPRGAAPWRLHFPAAQAAVNIDGVTRWDSRDAFPDMAVWTPDPASWFPFLENRWLLTPYRRTVFGPPGEQRQITLQVHNNALRERTIQLDLEFPDGPWPARLSSERVVVGARQTTPATVTCTMPATGPTRTVRVRATPLDDPGFSTYATLETKAGTAPAAQPLAMPLVLKPYQHENEQFGYLPDYPLENQVYFDLQNQPFIRTSTGVATRRDDRWTASLFSSAVKPNPVFAKHAFGLSSTKIAFDRDNDLYLLTTAGRMAALLHSTNGGKTFTACAIPGREDRPRTFDLEQFTGCNVPDSPPPILRYTQTARDEKLIWRRLNDLELFVPVKQDGRVVVGKPILISSRCIGWSGHSGIPASVVSRGSKVHVVWGEATDPQVKVAGVPTFVITYDRASGRLGQPMLVGHGAPANDVHNSPSITMDGQGFLHVLAGTHGRPFPYAQSLKPDAANAAWSEAVPAGETLGQTYIGLVCGSNDTLHSAFRLWRSGVEPFPASSYATLAYQRKRAGQPWEPPRVLIVSPFSEYSVFYHRLTIDRKGRLFLSYDYWSTYWFYRNDHFGHRRALLMSPDSGDTWKMADTQDLR